MSDQSAEEAATSTGCGSSSAVAAVASSPPEGEYDDVAVNLQAEPDDELLGGGDGGEQQTATSTTEPRPKCDSVEVEASYEKEKTEGQDQESEEEDPGVLQLPGGGGISLRRYVNEQGNFITGIDVTSEEAAAKRFQRAQRFGLTKTQPENFDKLHERGKRFGGQTPIIDGQVIKTVKQLPEIKDGGEIREEAVYLHGTNEMDTNDVFQYFRDYGPSFVEWIDDTSCNVVWEDPSSAKRALIGKGVNPVLSQTEREKLFSSADTDVTTTDSSGETQQITWRLGTPHLRSKQLLLRYANTLDVKEAGAAQRSQYYRKYGNPNLPQEMEWSRNRRKRKRPADLRNKIQSKRASGEGSDSIHATSTEELGDRKEEDETKKVEEKKGEGEEAEEEMDIDDSQSQSLTISSKSPTTLYSDQKSKQEGLAARVGAKNPWTVKDRLSMPTDTAKTENDLRQKLIARRSKAGIKIQLENGSRQVSMDTS